jgi:hypothetical protein
MIVLNRHVLRSGRPRRPPEAKPPLIIDAYTVGVAPSALQLLEVVTWKFRDVSEPRGGIQPIQRFLRLPTKSIEGADTLATSEASRSAVAVAADHAEPYRGLRITSIVSVCDRRAAAVSQAES